jgi:probable rRNA maturation factor
MIDVEILVASELWRTLGDVEGLARRAVEAGLAAAPQPPSGPSEISLLLADDAAVRELNRAWRAKDNATNVLSFPAPAQPAGPGARHLGDVALAFETAQREAEAEGKRLAEHASHLIVHGLLHLLGFDHDGEAEAREMEDLEVEALRRLGIANPYRDVVA